MHSRVLASQTSNCHVWTELHQKDPVSCFQFHQHRQRYHNLRIHPLFVANY